MASCPDQELLLGGLVDGELDAANTAMAEAHLARCEGCREEVERLQVTRTLLRLDGVRHQAPESLTQPLTRRERQCLKGLVDGLVPQQISAKLNISASAVHLYLRSARSKLGCSTIAQLVAKAIRLDLIDRSWGS